MPVRHSLIFLSFVIHLSLHLCASITASAQTLIPIPDTLSGNTLLLTIDDSVTQFFTGYNTATIGYNGSYLGPTLILRQGDSVTLHVRNALDDTTTTHWHGLHVSPMNDGGPHSLILPGQTWMPHFTVMDKAATYWYHPHLHGKTMAQIVKGAAGLIIVRDSEEAALALPRTYGVDDIPLIFQFQTFDTVTRQIMVNDDFDNAVVVNGTLNGMLNIPAQVVRLRLLNASSLRFFRFGISDNRAFYQIATDNSLLDAPVSLTRLELSPGERAEILIDFTGEQQGSTLFLKTFGSEMPTGYPGGPPLMTMPLGPLDNLDFIVLQFNVTAPASGAVTAIPDALVSNTIWSQAGASTRYINFTAQPMMSTNFFINNVKFDMGVINFSVQQETVEIWDINNLTFMAHPFHIHGNHFYVIEKNGMQPPLNEQGRKDVVLVPAMGSVKIITKYADFSDTMMPYMYHCHLLRHEDDGMMGQFTVSPVSVLTVSAVVHDVQCNSDGAIELSISGGVPPYYFQWSTGDTTQNLSGLAPGTYSLTVEDSYHSSFEYSYSVTDASLDIGSISGEVNPADSSVHNYSVISDSQYTYQWSVTNGQILYGQGTSEVQVQWGSGQGELMVIADNGVCSDTAMLLLIISTDNGGRPFHGWNLLLFQNPNNGNFILQVETLYETEIEISILNILGQKIFATSAEKVSSVFRKTISLNHAAGGICILKARIGNVGVSRKLFL